MRRRPAARVQHDRHRRAREHRCEPGTPLQTIIWLVLSSGVPVFQPLLRGCGAQTIAVAFRRSARPIEMPKLGYDMETGRIVSWLKAEGDRVAPGEPIAEIETDKATIEMEARASGVIVEIPKPAGRDVPVGTPIGTLET